MVGDLLREAHVHAPFETLEVIRKDSLDLTDDDREAIRRSHRRGAERPHRRHARHRHDDGNRARTAVDSRQDDRVDRRACRPRASPTPTRRSMSAWRLRAVQTLPAGVYIAMNGQVFDAANVRKDRATNRFVAT